MDMRILALCAATAFSFAVSPAANAGPNLNAAPKKSQSVVAPQAITAASAVQVYTPITPCREFSSFVLAKNIEKTVQVAGAGSSCGVPAYAKAVSINISVGNPAATSNLTAYAAGTTRPGISSVRFQAGQASQSGSIVAIGTGGAIALYAGSAVTTFGDVTGYFSPAVMSAGILSDGTVVRAEGLGAPAGTSRLGVGVYQVSFSRDIRECFYQVTAGEPGIGGATPRVVAVTRRSGDDNGVFIRINTDAGAAVDNDFFVVVSCGR